MQRTFLILCWLFAITLFSSCGHIDRKKKAVVYYKISATNDSLDKMTREWHQLVFKAASDKSYTNLASYRLNIGKFLARNRDAISNMDADAQEAPLVDSELTFLGSRANAVSDLYPRFELFNDQTPDDVLRTQLKDLPADLQNELSGSAAIKKSLRFFAAKNGLQIAK